MRETKRLQSSYCLNPITLGCQLLLAKPYSCHILTLQTNLPTSYCAIFRHETVHLFLIYEPCTCKRSEPLQQFLLLAKEVGNCRQFNRSIWVWFGTIFSFMSCLATGAYQKVSPLAAAVRVIVYQPCDAVSRCLGTTTAIVCLWDMVVDPQNIIWKTCFIARVGDKRITTAKTE